MKRTLSIILIIAFFLVGCVSNDKDTPTQSSSPEPEPMPTPTTVTGDEFYLKYMSNTRPFAVMIDNDDKNSRPHYGLQDAYCIYEVVVEGGSTRLMALFKDTDTAKIGPVRSSRHYFLDYMKEHDAIYVHYGWSPLAGSQIMGEGLDKINGILGSDAGAFVRNDKYRGDYHSVYTNMNLLSKMVAEKKFRTTSDVKPYNMSKITVDIGEDSANSIGIKYASFYSVGYDYNAESGLYMRSLNGEAHSLPDGAEYSAKNIIIMNVKSYSLGDGSKRQQLDTAGSGSGYYITGGKYIPITWSKPSRNAKTTWSDASGKEIILNSGQTWIQILPPSVKADIK